MTSLQRDAGGSSGDVMHPTTCVGVLGPITLERAGDDVELGPRLRRLLAALVVARGETVSADRLAEIVWDGEPPHSVDRTLPSYVTRLRRALGSGTDVVRYREPGYVLDAAAVDIDADRFENATDLAVQELRTADAPSALTTIEGALHLWRGSAYAGFGEDEWFRPEAIRLEGRRNEARLVRAEALLAVGDHEHAVADAEAMAAASPLSEAPRRLLMRALYAAGNQAGALRVLPDYRRLLADEVGLGPSAEIVELESRIARGERGLASTMTLRGYEVHERIGSGAFAVVHRAVQPGVEREVAVKIIHADLADRPEFIMRFEHEAHLAARLEHPHIVPLYDYWRAPGAAYLVMRLLRGGTVGDALRRGGPLPLDRALQVVGEIAAALSVAHRAGIVHRDVKPANILLDANGHAYLADFGIATAIRAVDNIEIESPAYAAPEQLRHEPVGPPGDVLSLGITVFEMLTGRLPFADVRTRAELVTCQLERPIPPVSATRTDLPAIIDDVLARATAKTAADRHPSVTAFATDFAAALQSSDADRSQRRRPMRIEAPPNPYVGLHAFDEADADRFNGRERLVAELADRVVSHRVVTVVGPSGTGKSSIVRAGLIPSLRMGAVPGSDQWFITTMVPGGDPFAALEVALLRVAVRPPMSLRDQLAVPGGLLRAVGRILPTDDARILVVIDQFEELFTQTGAADERRFLDELAAALTQPGCPLRIVATLRADHFDGPLAHRAIAPLVTQGLVPVVPMSADEIERAIVMPARSVDVDVEPALVADLVAAVTDRPGALPMLQFCLSEAFDRRVSDVMLLSVHRDGGGLTGAVAARADRAVFAGDDPAAGEQAARRLFGRLVAIGDDGDIGRRRASLSELAEDETTMWMIDALTKARLLSTGTDAVSHEPTVEIAHEALFREWPRLQGWIDEDRDDLRVLRDLSSAAATWEGSGREPGDLVRAGRLETAVAFRERRPELLSLGELEWIDASVAARDVAEQDGSRRARRLRRFAALAATCAVLAVVAGAVALVQRNGANRRAGELQVQRLTSASLAAREGDADLAILLALAAHDAAAELGDVPGEVIGALQATVQSSRLIARFDDTAGVATLSPDGGTVVYATAALPYELRVVDVDSGEARERHVVDRPPSELAFSPDGTSVAVAYSPSDESSRSGGDPPAIEVLTVDTWTPLAAISAGCCVDDLRFSPDGRLLAAEFHPPDVAPERFMVDTAVFDLTDPLRQPSIHKGYGLGGWIADGPALARFKPLGGTIEIVDPVTQQSAGADITAFGEILDADIDPGGTRVVAVASGGVEVRHLDGSSDVAFSFDGDTSPTHSVRISPDGGSFVTYGFDDGLRFTEIDSGASVLLGSGRSDHRSVAMSDAVRRLVAADSQQVTVWSLDPRGPGDLAAISLRREPVGMYFSDDGSIAVLATGYPPAADGLLSESFDIRTGSETDPSGSESGRRLARFIEPPPGRCRQFIDANDRWKLTGTTWDVGKFSANCDPEPPRLLDPDGQGLVAELPFQTGPARFGRPRTVSADLLAWTNDDQIGLYDVVADHAIGSFPGSGFGLEQPSFSPDGTLLAFGSLNDGAYVIDVERVLDGASMDESVVLHVGFDGTVVRRAVVGAGMLVTAHNGQEIVFWDLDTGERLMTLDNRTGHSPVIAFTPDERYLYYEAPGQVMRRMPLNADELVALARTRVQREFTAEECGTYFQGNRCPEVA